MNKNMVFIFFLCLSFKALANIQEGFDKPFSKKTVNVLPTDPNKEEEPAFTWEVVVPGSNQVKPTEGFNETKPLFEEETPFGTKAPDAQTAPAPLVQGPKGQETGLCNIPANVDVLHVPVLSWTHSDYFDKKKQEVLNQLEKSAHSFWKHVKEKTKAEEAWDFLQEKLQVQEAFEFLQSESKELPNAEEVTSQVEEGSKPVLSTKVPKIIEKRAYAQFVLAQIIKKNPQSVVFHEWTTKLHDSRRLNYFKYATEEINGVTKPEQIITESQKMEALFQLVNSQFDAGFPDSYDSLNVEQKETLAIVGGVYTLFFLYELPVIFPALSDVDYTNVYNRSNLNPYELTRCKDNNIANVCSYIVRATHENFQVRALKASFLAHKVQAFLSAFSFLFSEEATHLASESQVNQEEHSFPTYQKPTVILAYADYDQPEENSSFKLLSSYFEPSHNFYSLPKECLTPPTQMEPSAHTN